MAKFGIDSNMVFDADGKSVAARLSDHDTSLDGISSSLADFATNVKSYGADSSGVNDSTTAFQSAINYCDANNKVLFVPIGIYKIAGIITVPSTLVIKGDNRYSTVAGDSSKLQTKIYTSATTVFSSTSTVRVNIENIAFVNQNATAGTLFDFKFDVSSLTKNFFYNYFVVINQGIGGLCTIERNNFLNCQTSAIKGQVVDAYIANNYFNASVGNNNTYLIDVTELSMSKIINNFMDFAYTAIRVPFGNGATISNNIIDYCFKGLDLRGIISYKVHHNTFAHTTKSYASSNGRTPSTEMSTGTWIAIYLYNSIEGVSIEGNVGNETDILINMPVNAYKNIRTNGNICTADPSKTIVMNRAIAGSWFPDDGSDLWLSEMNYLNFSTYPSPSITGSNIQTFNNHIVVYNGKVLRNDNGTWKDMMGNTVTS
jgi:hypothetical protein